MRSPPPFWSDRSVGVGPRRDRRASACRGWALFALVALVWSAAGCASVRGWPKHDADPYTLFVVVPDERAQGAADVLTFELLKLERDLLERGDRFRFRVLFDGATEARRDQKRVEEGGTPPPPRGPSEPVDPRLAFRAPSTGCGPKCAREAAWAADADVVLVLDLWPPSSIDESGGSASKPMGPQATTLYATVFAGTQEQSILTLDTSHQSALAMADALVRGFQTSDLLATLDRRNGRKSAAPGPDTAPSSPPPPPPPAVAQVAPPGEPEPGMGDRDGDGVLDRDDVCPDQPGPASNRGCPEPAPAAVAPGTPPSTAKGVAAVKERANAALGADPKSLAQAPSQAATVQSPARPAPAPAMQGKLIAVLEIRSQLSAKDKESLPRSYFSDRIRRNALKSLPGARIISRENMETVARANGVDLEQCEGLCAVETGQKLGADLVVSGDLLKVGSQFKLTLSLHDTRAGDMVGSGEAGGQSADALLQHADAAISELFAPLRR